MMFIGTATLFIFFTKCACNHGEHVIFLEQCQVSLASMRGSNKWLASDLGPAASVMTLDMW
jgi:hypothetical protein